MGRIIGPLKVQLDDIDIRLVKFCIRFKKSQIGKNDRSNPEIDPEVVSFDGMCAEIACLYLLGSLFMVSPRVLITQWWNDCKTKGSNYGRDILAYIFNLDKDIEVKCTIHYGPDKGYCYMRVGSGVGYAVQKYSFWDKHLPDSYYLLFKVHNNNVFELICWATRDMLLNNFKIWCDKYKINLPFGYDTLGIVHHMANPPATFLPKIKPKDVSDE